MEDLIVEQGLVEIDIENVDELSKTAYAIMRKDGFGASDSSVLLGVNLYKEMPALIKEKQTKYLTAEEEAIGEKVAVKKGYDLEPLIMKKAEEILGTEIDKPKHMYRLKDCPILKINYDGVTKRKDHSGLIPVEAKFVTKWGEKYYKKNISHQMAMLIDNTPRHAEIANHIKFVAEQYGIPGYYYTQLQQQIAGLDAPYGYLAALFEESWECVVYKAKRDDYVIRKLKVIAEDNADKIKKP